MKFFDIEKDLATVAMNTFENIRLSTGTVVFGAVLDRSIEFVGEYGATGERRSRITVARADAASFQSGIVLQADPLTYSPAELASMERTSWTLDRMDIDDGHLVSWWLR